MKCFANAGSSENILNHSARIASILSSSKYSWQLSSSLSDQTCEHSAHSQGWSYSTLPVAS